MYELILASKSPRRKLILEEAGYQFRIIPIEVSEILNKNLNLADQISDCARQKAEAAAEVLNVLESQNILILGADTVVVFQNKVLGKPKNHQEALFILNQLSGQVHTVTTGFCLFDLREKHLVLGHESTEVKFKKLSEKQILDYIATGDCFDKAGAYGIQGEAGAFVDTISGSYLNVVGLPIEKITKTFTEHGWQIAKQS